MLQELLRSVIHLGWLALPYPFYALYNRYYLELREQLLLLLQCLILASLMLPGWALQALRLIINGSFALVTLDLCIIEYIQFAARYQIKIEGQQRRSKKYQLINNKPIFFIGQMSLLKKFRIKQTWVIIVAIMLWVFIKVRFTKAAQFGIGLQLDDNRIFQGLLVTLDGWNCNYPQLTIISAFCLCVLIFCYWFIASILANSKLDCTIGENSDLNQYKIYLQKYLIAPSLLIFAIDFIYNLLAHLECDGLLQCYNYYKYGILFHVVIDWGVAFSIGWFFHKKKDRFSLQSEMDNSIKSLQNLQDNLSTPLQNK